jgi:hypothetical protein
LSATHLDILRRYLKDETVDLVYLDPRQQLRTGKELMEGKGIERPSTVAAKDETFKKAPESKKKQHEQKALEL